MSEKPIENEATREARKRGVKGAFRPSMTANAERQEAERLGDWLHRYLIKHGLTDFAIDAIAAALKRVQDEVLEMAAQHFEQHSIRSGWKVDSISSHLRALKK